MNDSYTHHRGHRLCEADLIAEVRQAYQDIYVILAPPRSASTALARVFWECPSIGSYSHEPFDLIYHKHLHLESVLHAFRTSIQFRTCPTLILKEMTFQVGSHFQLLTQITRHPLIFLIRDPRLSIWSRMQKRKQGGQNPLFPLVESGWDDLTAQIHQCRQMDIPYVIVDSTDIRNKPTSTLQQLFGQLHLPFDKEMLNWQPFTSIQLGNLDSEQRHWYERILNSTTIEPATEQCPDLAQFPHEFHEHLNKALISYLSLRQDRNCI